MRMEQIKLKKGKYYRVYNQGMCSDDLQVYCQVTNSGRPVLVTGSDGTHEYLRYAGIRLSRRITWDGDVWWKIGRGHIICTGDGCEYIECTKEEFEKFVSEYQQFASAISLPAPVVDQ